MIFLGVIAFLVLFVVLLGPPLARQISDLASHIPDYVQKLANRDNAIGRYFRAHDVTQNVKDFVQDIPTKIAHSFDTVLGIAASWAAWPSSSERSPSSRSTSCWRFRPCGGRP